MTGKLALRNVRRSLRDYAVYFITLTFGVCLFYVFNSLSGQSVMKLLSQSQHGIVEGIFMLVEVFSAFVSAVLAVMGRPLVKRLAALHVRQWKVPRALAAKLNPVTATRIRSNFFINNN